MFAPKLAGEFIISKQKLNLIAPSILGIHRGVKKTKKNTLLQSSGLFRCSEWCSLHAPRTSAPKTRAKHADSTT